MKITAEIVPNVGKYYGTEIKLTNEYGETAHFEVWVNGIGSSMPSTREIDFVGRDGKFYVLDPDEDEQAWEYDICDDHYETQAALEICQKIVEALNWMEVT